ncbi:hypothetical protein L2088_25025 [Pseudomonas protegens]|uniref:hypothetical protein n=1 Tax=Pseudomonas protegens TaxID=380021 RepID=UPI002024CD87|nr:hypothetical protein [Pseudomonas protegens]MCL9657981.1 hypothetical protein [Pseudomonas protegens]
MNNKNSNTFQRLKCYIKESKRSVWLGNSHSPINSTNLNLENSKNMRANQIHHGQYDVVWIYSKSIFDYLEGWKIILDEAIRLCAEHSKIIVRSLDNSYGTLFELKSLLFRNQCIDVSLDLQFSVHDNFTVSVFSITRKELVKYQDKSWSVGILSNGKKEDIVKDLINSILISNKKNIPVEFIIAGPKLTHIENHNANIRYVSTNIKDELARIADKKNKIIESANNCNIAIFHDRYIVAENFFDGFEKFGYDFDFLTVSQYYEDDSEFPSYLTFEKKEKRWQTPLHIENHDKSPSGAFLNGGLIILKKHLSTRPIFNDLLLHNEAEDVEAAFNLTELGVVPRFNGYSKVTTVGIPLNYTSTFLSYSKVATPTLFQKVRLKSLIYSAVYFAWAHLPKKLRLKISRSTWYVQFKNFIRT